MSAANRGSARIAEDNYPTPAWCVDALLANVDLPLEMHTRSTPLPDAPRDHDLECHCVRCWDVARPRQARWLEPCAGECAIVRAVTSYCGRHDMPKPQWILGDVREECSSAMTTYGGPDAIVRMGDARNCNWPTPDVAITNPPFDLALPIAQKLVERVSVVALLLRLNWLGSGKESGRSAWLKANPPDVYVLDTRPAFVASDKCAGRNTVAESRPSCGWSQKVPLDVVKPRVCPACGGKVTRTKTDATEYAWFVWGMGGGRVQIIGAPKIGEAA